MWALSAGVGLVYLRAWRTLPVVEPNAPPEESSPHQSGPSVGTPLTGEVWKVMAGRGDRRADAGAARSLDRFRLAGTFFIESASGEPARKAILDDPTKRQQYILGEGGRVEEIVVLKIFQDHVTIQGPAGNKDVWIDFSTRGRIPEGTGSTQAVAAVSTSSNRFGCVQTQENRWQFSRQPLMDYYQELLDEPARMVSIFDTMKPVRDEQNKITGYIVGIEGEKDFFDAAGLRQGDIVRSVNSVPMTNRKRAEFFIDEFLKDNMSAVVLDIERGGQPVKQIYQVRK
jgi:type II secretory pathway component PulC